MQGGEAKRAIMGEAYAPHPCARRTFRHPRPGVRPDSAEEPRHRDQETGAGHQRQRAPDRLPTGGVRSRTLASSRKIAWPCSNRARMIADEGCAALCAPLETSPARHKDLRERVITIARTFKSHDRHLCGIAIVLRKPKGEQLASRPNQHRVPTPIMTDLQDIASMIRSTRSYGVAVMHAEGVRLVLATKDEILQRAHAAAIPVILHTLEERPRVGATAAPRCQAGASSTSARLPHAVRRSSPRSWPGHAGRERPKGWFAPHTGNLV